MGHPEIDNGTPFTVELLLLEDPAGVPLACAVVKATYALGAKGALQLAEEQRPVYMAGEPHGEPGRSSYKHEPEVAFEKPSTDVVLLGHAVARNKDTRQMVVSLQLGGIHKRVRVTGDRCWDVDAFGPRLGEAQVFERIPLTWENAFGGRERHPRDPAQPRCEPCNPVGKGYNPSGAPLEPGASLPNLEYPEDPLLDYFGRVRPAGFGFTCCHWQPRAALAGTYDEAWLERRAPLLAEDFQLAHFQGAPADQVSVRPLLGNEAVEVRGTTEAGVLRLQLPGLEAPRVAMRTRQGDRPARASRLDTVVIDSDAMELTLTYRHSEPLQRGVHDLQALTVTCDNAPERPAPGPSETNVVPIGAAASQRR